MNGRGKFGSSKEAHSSVAGGIPEAACFPRSEQLEAQPAEMCQYASLPGYE
jgi:hypothetical protein